MGVLAPKRKDFELFLLSLSGSLSEPLSLSPPVVLSVEVRPKPPSLIDPCLLREPCRLIVIDACRLMEPSVAQVQDRQEVWNSVSGLV